MKDVAKRSILSFEKPKKIRNTEAHNEQYQSDSGIPGTYVPNMSEEDNEKWKAEHITGSNERIEIRKLFHKIGYAQTVVIVYKDNHIQMSANAKMHMTFEDFDELIAVVAEAKETMKEHNHDNR